MSIAVSTVIRPSRLLRAMLAAYAAVNLGVAAFLLSSAPGTFRARLAVAAACLLAAAAASWALGSAGNKRRIDISGVGEMRVAVQQKLTQSGMQNTLVRLRPGSVVWPRLMVLLVGSEGGGTAVLAVFADSVGVEQFRALAVAIRAIGDREAPDQVFFEPHKIL